MIMKKIFKNILLIIAVNLAAASCTDQLDQHPAGLLTQSDFYQDEDDVRAAVNGVYSILTESGRSSGELYGYLTFYLNDFTVDYLRIGVNAQSTETRGIGFVTYDAGNLEIQATWEQLYKGISHANLAIDNIPTVSVVSEEVRERLIHEVKFLRALLYFNAVQFFGDIPLLKSSTPAAEDRNRQSREEVYKFIIQDLKEAAAVLPPDRDAVHATRGAALALLARVYLVRSSLDGLPEADVTADLDSAVAYAYKVIDSNQYRLFDNFYDNFDPAKKNGSEHIFSAQFAHLQNGSWSGNIGQHCPWATGFSQSEPVVIINDTTLFYDSFAEGDQRKDGSYLKRITNPENGELVVFTLPRLRKLIDTTYGAAYSASAINVEVIRYADVLFTFAEALNELKGPDDDYNGISAREALNRIRRRAFHEGIHSASENKTTPHDLEEGLNRAQFRDTLRKERYFEFVEEQVRWFDLVRWKILVRSLREPHPNHPNGLKENATARNYLFPIPHSERLLNPALWQNYGYDGSTITENPYKDYEPGWTDKYPKP
jgi:hypothetical protein